MKVHSCLTIQNSKFTYFWATITIEIRSMHQYFQKKYFLSDYLTLHLIVVCPTSQDVSCELVDCQQKLSTLFRTRELILVFFWRSNIVLKVNFFNLTKLNKFEKLVTCVNTEVSGPKTTYPFWWVVFA